jgi:hypothetical protein
MCINRSWDSIESNNYKNTFWLVGKRSDGIYCKVQVITDIKDSIGERLKQVADLPNKLETYRNCECPNNPECHKMIDGKLNVITAHNKIREAIKLNQDSFKGKFKIDL